LENASHKIIYRVFKGKITARQDLLQDEAGRQEKIFSLEKTLP
jgi:hypothetical protein